MPQTATAVRPAPDLVVQATGAELEALRELARHLADGPPALISFGNGGTLPLPDAVTAALRLAVDYLARGLAVAIEPYTEVLTTQRAADLLDVSRPYMVNLIEEGRIPLHARTKGAHRRVLLADVLAYRDQLRSGGELAQPQTASDVHASRAMSAGADHG